MSFQVPKGNIFATTNVNESLGIEIATLTGMVYYNILNIILEHFYIFLEDCGPVY